MRLALFSTLAVAALSLGAGAVAMTPDPPNGGSASPLAGVWANGNNTMHVRAGRCGSAVCGTVVWADDQTKALIASKGRTLIGTQVFRDFRPSGSNEWRGKVYVPAIDQTINGRIVLTDRNSITASGCALLGLGCQTRHWKRIS